jgi:hypothetical protein
MVDQQLACIEGSAAAAAAGTAWSGQGAQQRLIALGRIVDVLGELILVLKLLRLPRLVPACCTA